MKLYKTKKGIIIVTGFSQQMIKYSRQKICFVTDGHPAYKTKMLDEWLAENIDRIGVFFLPSYSRGLNPLEYVNHDVKTNMERNALSTRLKCANVEVFIYRRKNDKKQVQKYFEVYQVRYAA